MARLAILAGQGELPQKIAQAHPNALFMHFDGIEVDLPDNDCVSVSYERFGELFDFLLVHGVTEVVFIGGLARPKLDPAKFDARMCQLAPGFMAAMAQGDDALLRAVIKVFEAEGYTVRGAHELLAGLTAEPGVLAGPTPSDTDLADVKRAREILEALGPLDVGQGVVVACGLVLGIETAQGTDAMLRFVARTPKNLRHDARGVLVKAPKAGQDLRVDMPAIGPDTIAAAARAGLSGVVITAGQVLLTDRSAIEQAAQAEGIFLLAEPV